MKKLSKHYNNLLILKLFHNLNVIKFEYVLFSQFWCIDAIVDELYVALS